MKVLQLLKPRREHNIKIVCQKLFDIYGIKYSDLNVEKLVEEHIDNYSMLSIKDTLSEYGIESVAIRKNNYNYYDFETPFICAVQQEDWPSVNFTLVSIINETSITYLDPLTNKFKETSLSDFDQLDKGIVLLVDDTNKKDELDLSKHIAQQRNQAIARDIPIYLSIIILLSSLWYATDNFQEGITWVNIIFTISSFMGIVVSSLLLWHEIDAHNPLLREVCGGQGKKVNCDAVLHSSRSRFLGISWAIWGFSFMISLFSIQVFFSGNLSFLYLSVLLSLIASPYILFSIYYQAKVIKQWCPLCLVVQALLLINSITAMFFLYNRDISFELITIHSIVLTLFIALFFIISTHIFIPIIKSARDNGITEKKWKKLRYNPDIFQALLDKSDKVTASTEGLGIVFGNPHAKNEIIKVCNPYCGPCAKAHPELENILKNNFDVKVRIIFTASGDDDDILNEPVQHLLAIQEKNGREAVHHALDDWYLSQEKDYNVFAKKYPMNEELKQQKDKIIAMYNWCNTMKIRATPTIYINGSELPDSYRVSELKNIL